MGLIIGGLVVAVVGVILWIVMGKRAGKAAVLDLTDTSRVTDVNENYQSTLNSMGPNSFTHFCEVKGQAHADDPLKSDLAEAECVYFSSKVVHEYKVKERRKDSNGNYQTKWVNKSETVSENSQWANGWGVKDDTGFIAVNAAKSEIHTEQLFSNFEQGEPGSNGGLNVKIGNFSLGIGGNNDYKTIGYRYSEEGIKVGSNLYVLGDANDRDGNLIVSKPIDKKQPFIVSTKSEDELMSGLGSAVKGFKIGAFAAWGVGGILVVVGILKLVGAM
ncbi:MAG: E3 ubiquitin ligase family protein [Crocinitomicaceae bacterium]|nr:E3 ubiquitin ligase family protein [Crocinitomicaceae bacterium]